LFAAATADRSRKVPCAFAQEQENPIFILLAKSARTPATREEGDLDMIDSGSIREHMDVVGSDGKHIGKVDHVLGGDLQLTRSMGVGSHHLLPLTYVESVSGDKIRLSITEDEAKNRWRELH
jgi:hypothetical protein